MELYKTVRTEAEATNIIEKSRFIAHVKPVSSKEEADAFVAEIKGKYKDATHNVPAMVIGDKFQIQWASDDGEPQGTSGAPMVQMLVKEGITNVVIVVTRYFGGIKLGTGGLVRAYTGSAKLGLEAAGVCSVREVCSMDVKADYTYLSKFQNMAADVLGDDEDPAEVPFVIKDVQYTDKVVLTVLTFPEKADALLQMLANLTSGSAEVIDRKTILEKV
ncbi:MAG: YigZ family protein [Bacillota bacterium]|nr:YigZ family protein [Bacillota bacterium]